MDRDDKNYDWSLEGFERNPTTKLAVVLGLLFWVIMAACVWLVWRG